MAFDIGANPAILACSPQLCDETPHIQTFPALNTPDLAHNSCQCLTICPLRTSIRNISSLNEVAIYHHVI